MKEQLLVITERDVSLEHMDPKEVFGYFNAKKICCISAQTNVVVDAAIGSKKLFSMVMHLCNPHHPCKNVYVWQSAKEQKEDVDYVMQITQQLSNHKDPTRIYSLQEISVRDAMEKITN